MRIRVWLAAMVVFALALSGMPAVAGVQGDTTGVVDQTTGIWYLRDAMTGATTSFYYGNPGDYPIVGDWDCDSIDTPGLYRQSDGYVYLRNSNTQGIADIRFYFGNPGDIPLPGDFNNDGCDTVSIYRPSEARIYVINKLGANDGGLGAADYDFYFGNPGDKPFVGDFNNNGQDTVGLHRESTGFVYYRNTLTTGIADNDFFYGDPGDQIIAGRWVQDPTKGPDTVGLFRPSNGRFYLRFENSQGNANVDYSYGNSNMAGVAGYFGKLPGGDAPPPGTATTTTTTTTLPVGTFGPPFPISERSSSESQPAIAYNSIDQEFLVVWSNYWGPSGWDIYAQRVSLDGRLLSWFYVGDGWYPDVAYNPTNNSFLVVYQRDGPVNADNIWARRVTYAGPLSPEFPVANSSAPEGHPSVTFNEHANFRDFMVVWEKSDQIQAQRVAGTPQGGPGGSELIGPTLDVSQPGKLAWWPDIAYNLNRNEYLVVYQQESSAGSFVFDVYGRRITGDSFLLPEQAIDASSNDQYLPRVAAYSPNHATPYLVVFEDQWNDSQGDVRGYLVNGDGLPQSLVNISTASNIYEGNPDVVGSRSSGGYTVVWLKTDGDTHLMARSVGHDGSVEATFQVTKTALMPGYFSESAIAAGQPVGLVAWETSGQPLRDLAGAYWGTG